MTKKALKGRRPVPSRKPARGRGRSATRARAPRAIAPASAAPVPSAQPSGPPRARLELDPDDMQRSLMRLLLSLAGFIRDLLERQTLRRIERKTLSAAEIERLGRALMQLEGAIGDLARQFDLEPEDLNLDLGPLGRLR